MSRVLAIDGDAVARRTLSELLTYHGYEYAGAGSGSDGLRAARDWNPGVVLVALRLPDMSGLEVLGELAAKCPSTMRILVTGYATLDVAIQAMRLGSCDCLCKPASQQEVLDAVERALRRSQHTETEVKQLELTTPVAYAAVRVAEPIVRVIDELTDPYTLRRFAKAAAVSVGGFRNWCRTAGLKSRATVLFARGLRAVYQFEQDRSTRPENLLTIVDRRTIAKFVKKSGGQGDRLPDTVFDFLDRQQFIANRELIDAVRQAFTNRQETKGSTSRDTRGRAADGGAPRKGPSRPPHDS